MRVKQDIVPRRYTYAWFYATKPGTYRLTCAEYCGTNHSQMACLDRSDDRRVPAPRGRRRARARRLRALPRRQGRPIRSNMPPVELGKMLYEKKGCNACHTVDGTRARRSDVEAHDFGTTVALTDGTHGQDGRELHPRVDHVAAGEGASRLSRRRCRRSKASSRTKRSTGLIAYIKSLK